MAECKVISHSTVNIPSLQIYVLCLCFIQVEMPRFQNTLKVEICNMLTVESNS